MGIEVNVATGNLFFDRSDIYIPARKIDFNIKFSYNSLDLNRNLGYGNGWTFNYSMYYKIDGAGRITLTRGDGRKDIYISDNGVFIPPVDIFDSLTQYHPDKYLLVTKEGTKFYFDDNIHKRLTKITEPNGNLLNLSYTDSLVTNISNSSGQSIALNYTNGLLNSVTDAMTSPIRTYTYSYDEYKNLIKVTDPMHNTYKYSYLINGPLEKVIDKNENVADIIYYHNNAVSEIITCNSRQSFSYASATSKTTVIDYVPTSENQVTSYTFNNNGWISQITGNCCGYNISYTYDKNGNILTRKDAKGNIYSYTYDNRGNTLTATDPLNKKVSYTHTADFNHIKSITDQKGSTTNIIYDTKGNPVNVTEPGNIQFKSTYNSNGDLISSTDGVGNIVNFSYDSYGHLNQVSGPLGMLQNFISDARANIIASTDALERTTAYQYDSMNRPIIITNPLKNNITIAYDAQGNPLSATDENSHTTTYNYDASNRLVTFADPTGNKVFYTYDALNNVTHFTDRNGNTTSFDYDNLNRVIGYKDAANNIYSFSYDPNGNRISASLPNGNIISNTYDQLDRLTGIHDNYGTVGTITYDDNDNLLTYTNGTGNTVSYNYDALNRPTRAIDAFGKPINYSYDNNDHLITKTDRNNRVAAYAYDALNRPVSYTNPLGGIVAATYDTESNLQTLTDENNHATNFTYDSLDRTETEVYPDGSFTRWGYDNVGNLVSKRLTDGNKINYNYDALDRANGKTLPGNDVYSYSYDPEGRLMSATNNNGTVSIAYDAIDRSISETFNGHTATYSYNTAAGIEQTTYPSGTIVTRNFDFRNRLTSLKKDGSALADYTYNNAGQVQQMNFTNGINTNLQYDGGNRLSNQFTTPSAIQQLTFQYDKEGNKTVVARPNLTQSSETFTYDNNYRLTGFKQGALNGNTIPGPVLNNAYVYDALGNRTSTVLNGQTINYTSNSLNQYIITSNNTKTINYAYDRNGNLTYDGNFYKRYDAEGRKLTDSTSPGNTIQYKYDAFGRKIKCIINGTTTNYYFTGLAEIEQRNAVDSLLEKTLYESAFTPVSKYINNKTYYFHQNDINSVEALTDSAGRLVERYLYDVYGKPYLFDSLNNSLPNSLVNNQIFFTGQKFNFLTGTYQFHFRNYSPASGSFERRDPLGYTDGMSMYRYARNNPANKTDILGLLSGDPFEVGPGDDAGFVNRAKKNAYVKADYYKMGKTYKDGASLLSALSKFLLDDGGIKNGENFSQWKDFISTDKSQAAGNFIKKYLDNIRILRSLVFFKAIYLPEKFYKIYKAVHCGHKQEVVVKSAEATISILSFLYSYEKLRGITLLTGSRLGSLLTSSRIGYFALLDIISNATTGKSVLTNVVDLPLNSVIILDAAIGDQLRRYGPPEKFSNSPLYIRGF